MVYAVIAAGTDAAAVAGTVAVLAILALVLVERRVAQPLLPPSLCAAPRSVPRTPARWR